MADSVSADPIMFAPPARVVTRAPWVERWSWALYDFSNTIWSMNVSSLYFTTWLVVDLGSSNAAVGWATAISSLLMAVSAPVFGAISDARRRRKPWVVWFTILSCVATAAIQWRAAFAEVKHTVRDARQHPGTIRFIIASFVYQDAIGTIAFALGLYAIKAVGFAQSEVNTLYILLTVPAVLGSYVCGRLVDRYGAKRTLVSVIVSWAVLLGGIMLLPGKPAFWAIGALVGFIFGGVPTAERPLLLSLVPEAEAGRFFSLLLLSSRAASFLGPVVWALTVDNLEPRFGSGLAYRAAVGTVALFFVASLFVLYAVPNKRGARALATD